MLLLKIHRGKITDARWRKRDVYSLMRELPRRVCCQRRKQNNCVLAILRKYLEIDGASPSKSCASSVGEVLRNITKVSSSVSFVIRAWKFSFSRITSAQMGTSILPKFRI